MLLHSQTCFLFLWVLRGFTSPGSQSNLKLDSSRITRMGFPHSEISGSKIVRHLPEAYRSRTTSFIAILCQGIHHTLLNFPLGNLKTTSLNFCENIYYNIFLPLLNWFSCQKTFVLSKEKISLRETVGKTKFGVCLDPYVLEFFIHNHTWVLV